MIELNKVFLVGNLTADPEFRMTSSGKGVARLRMAVNRRGWGGGQDETLFIDVTVWEKTAEFAKNYLHKGSAIFVEGRLKQFRVRYVGGHLAKPIHVIGETNEPGLDAGPQNLERMANHRSARHFAECTDVGQPRRAISRFEKHLARGIALIEPLQKPFCLLKRPRLGVCGKCRVRLGGSVHLRPFFTGLRMPGLCGDGVRASTPPRWDDMPSTAYPGSA